MRDALERPAYRCQHPVQHRADGRILPDIPGLCPLQLWIETAFVYLDRRIHSEVCCQRSERILPEAIFTSGAQEAETKFINWVVGTQQDLDVDDRTAVLSKDTKGDPGRSRVIFRRHQCVLVTEI